MHHHKHPSGIGNGTSKRPNMPRYQFYCCCCCTATFVVPGLIRSPLVIRIRYALQEREMGHAISPIGLVIKCFHITVVLLHTLWTLLHKSQVFHQITTLSRLTGSKQIKTFHITNLALSGPVPDLKPTLQIFSSSKR